VIVNVEEMARESVGSSGHAPTSATSPFLIYLLIVSCGSQALPNTYVYVFSD
jgi:hypothetical protein